MGYRLALGVAYDHRFNQAFRMDSTNTERPLHILFFKPPRESSSKMFAPLGPFDDLVRHFSSVFLPHLRVQIRGANKLLAGRSHRLLSCLCVEECHNHLGAAADVRTKTSRGDDVRGLMRSRASAFVQPHVGPRIESHTSRDRK